MFTHNSITNLFKIQFPIIQAGMIWASGWQLAAAVSNAGGLGLLGSGSMYPSQLEEEILQLKKVCGKPFGVNIPLLYADVEKHIEIIIKHKVPIVFTSAGNPKTYTQLLKSNGIIVVHVVSSSLFAQKAQAAGCDAVVAEGFEAGGHNGREETTTMVLIPQVKQAISIPLIAAGGIANANQMLAAIVLGANAVQVGSRFICTPEASSHINFKNAILNAHEGDTMLSLKKNVPVRLLKNNFFKLINEAEKRGASEDELKTILGRGRAKKGMYEGDLENGELEVGQVASMITQIMPAAQIVEEFIREIQKISLQNLLN
jgi:enoyl-[acyl-carrier protein] reductase II